jgi:AcrR family transcriptional regulator
VSTGKAEKGRVQQKQRTRQQILTAAAALISSGSRPTVTEAADAAEVSRRTAYRYFPSQEKLLTEATLNGVRPAIEEAMAAAPTGDSIEDIEARLVMLVHTVQKLTLRNEALLRTMIHATVLEKTRGAPKRGTRRLEWIELAVGGLQRRLKPAAYERLLTGLALCIGIEAFLVFRDIRGLSGPQATEASEWLALTVLRATLREGRHER